MRMSDVSSDVCSSDLVALPDGRKVVERRLEEQPDLVLTDVFMPHADGLEVIAAIRQNYPDARIVAMTGVRFGLTLDTVFEWAKAFGANTLLRKPFSREELVSSLAI